VRRVETKRSVWLIDGDEGGGRFFRSPKVEAPASHPDRAYEMEWETFSGYEAVGYPDGWTRVTFSDVGPRSRTTQMWAPPGAW
jgi:hypothetical protein